MFSAFNTLKPFNVHVPAGSNNNSSGAAWQAPTVPSAPTTPVASEATSLRNLRPGPFSDGIDFNHSTDGIGTKPQPRPDGGGKPVNGFAATLKFIGEALAQWVIGEAAEKALEKIGDKGERPSNGNEGGANGTSGTSSGAGGAGGSDGAGGAGGSGSVSARK